MAFKMSSPFKLKDACYHKVKAQYDVFPSAYASGAIAKCRNCLLYTSPSPRDRTRSRMPSSA